MGNHQFGFLNRVEFLGKSWSYVNEKRKSVAGGNGLRRPYSSTTISKNAENEWLSVDGVGVGGADADAKSGGGGRRPGTVKRTRSNMRCSPTVPESLTLSLAAAADDQQTSTALDALQRLTPAAPKLFREPSFDEFFEEAERRRRTIDALRAAKIVQDDEYRPSIDRLASPAAYDARRSPARSSIISLRSSSRQDSRQDVNDEERPITGDRSCSPPGNSVAPTTPPIAAVPSNNRLVVIVDRSTEIDRQPPTIIVQSEEHSPFVPNGSPMLTQRSDQLRRNSVNPANSLGFGVRFADECPASGSAVDELDEQAKKQLAEAKRRKRRSSLRRKTIGGVAYLNEKPSSSSGNDDASDGQSRKPLQTELSENKKSLSRYDLLALRPIIDLLRPAQITLIRQLWQQLFASKGPTVLGTHIFQRVFFKDARVKQVFRSADVGNRHVNVDFMCKTHAKAVAQVLDDVVRNLDNLQEVEAKLIEVGRQHAVFHDMQFDIGFWSVFAEAFIDCTLEWGEKNRRVDEARKAWAIIIAHITDKMKLGFQEARRGLPKGARRVRSTDSESALAY